MLETQDEFFVRIDPIITKQARLQHKNAGSIEVVDIEQEIRLKFLSEWNRIKGRKDEELSYLAYQAAATFCAKERSDYMYFSGAFMYSGEHVEKLLREDVWADVEDGYDIEGRLDLIAALEKLTKPQRLAILARYRDKEPVTSAQRDAANRGLRSITDSLNSGHAYTRVDAADASEEV